MKALLPYSIGSRDIPSLFSLCSKVQQSNDANIELDGSKVEFIDPQGLAVLGALLAPMTDRRISMPWLPTNIAGYMERMNFFSHCSIEDVEVPAWGRNKIPDKLVELTCVKSRVDSDAVANRLADAITGTLTTANPHAPYDRDTGKNHYDRLRYPIWYSLSELLENSLTHARQKDNYHASVWVASQYYEKTGIVKMAVVDNGCGMLATLAGHPDLPKNTHLSAISTALVPRVSCNRDGSLYMNQGNQGVGLTTTARIARTARGWLVIASGDSYLHTNRMNDGGLLPNGGHWQGVSIGFHCRREDLPKVRVPALLPPEPAEVVVKFVE
jgi:hypothetical protein